MGVGIQSSLILVKISFLVVPGMDLLSRPPQPLTTFDNLLICCKISGGTEVEVVESASLRASADKLPNSFLNSLSGSRSLGSIFNSEADLYCFSGVKWLNDESIMS